MFGLDVGSIVKGLAEGIVGPITSVLNKKQDVSLEKYRIDGTVNVEALRSEIEARKLDLQFRSLVATEKWVKTGRAALVSYTVLYLGLVFYDSCFRELLPDYMTWRVLALPEHLRYVPHLTVTLLIGEAAYNRFKK